MPKSQIIKDIVEEKVSIEKSMLRIMILAKDIKNDELEKWTEQEINGYKDKDDVPEYRKFHCSSIRYSGINGGFQVTHVPLPLGMLSEKTMSKVSDIAIFEGVKTISEMAGAKETLSRDISFLASEIFEKTEGKVTCTSIDQIIPNSVFQTIIAAIKSKMITILYELEDKYGNLDELGIDISTESEYSIKKNNKDINNAVFTISMPTQEKWYSKIAWNILIPIITAIIGGIVTAVIMSVWGL